MKKPKFAQVLIGTGLKLRGHFLIDHRHQGYDTISTFLLGILNFVDVPFGLPVCCFNIIVLLIVAVFDRAELGIGSFINGIGLGLLIGIFEPVMDKVSIHLPFILGSLFSQHRSYLGSALVSTFLPTRDQRR